MKYATMFLLVLLVPALLVPGCGKAKTDDSAPPPADRPATGTTEIEPPEPAAPSTAENPALAALRAKAAEIQKTIDGYAATLDGIGDVDALKASIQSAKASLPLLMGPALEEAKKKLSDMEKMLAQYDEAFNARKSAQQELAGVQGEISDLEDE